jgi:hypothetical protein
MRGIDKRKQFDRITTQEREKDMKTKYPIIENAKRQARMCFSGIAIPMLVEIPDDKVVEGEDDHYVYSLDGSKRYLVTEKVLKFNRKALRRAGKVKTTKADPRVVGGEDTMIIPVGKPGSRERVEALRSQYEAITAHGEEVSPFSWRGE